MKNKLAWIPFSAVPCALLAAAVLLAYANVYHNEFLFDDPVLITGDKFLTSWRYIGTLFTAHIDQGFSGGLYHDPFYRPLQMLLYLFVYQTAGPSTAAFHLLNVVLHTLNACLLYALGLRLGFQRNAALLAALLWALHPVHTEAVTYMSGTADPLCGAFLLAALLALTAGFSPRRAALACLFSVLALLSKETAAVFPLLAMGLIFYREENRWSPRAYLKTWPFWLVAALYLTARSTVLNFSGVFAAFNSAGTPLIDRLYTSLATLPVYLRLLVWPAELHMERGFPVYTNSRTLPVLAGFALVALACACVVWKPARRATPLTWGILWVAALHVPQSGILAPNDALIAEHWLYLPTMGLALGAAQTVAVWLEGKQKAVIGAVIVCAVMAAAALGEKTFSQNEIWRDPQTFYGNIFSRGEQSGRARVNFGEYFLDRGEFDKAATQFEALFAHPDAGPLYKSPQPHLFLAMAYLRITPVNHDLRGQIHAIVTALPAANRVPDAIAELGKALELDPDNFWANETLALIYAYQKDREKAYYYANRARAALEKKRPE